MALLQKARPWPLVSLVEKNSSNMFGKSEEEIPLPLSLKYKVLPMSLIIIDGAFVLESACEAFSKIFINT
jgi:hypothetical protein